MVRSQTYSLLPSPDAYNILYVCFLPVISILLKQLNGMRTQPWGIAINNYSRVNVKFTGFFIRGKQLRKQVLFRLMMVPLRGCVKYPEQNFF